MRVLFMGTPDFSVEVLKAIEAAGHEIVAVYSQPPRPAGRGKKERKSPVHTYAGQQGWRVETPLNFKDSATVERLELYKADVAVVVAYGLILPQPVLDAPALGCLNVHASLLPRWRGAAPIQRAIEAGDTVTGVSIMQMDAGLDTGPEVSRVEVPITDETTYATLHDELASVGAKALVQVISGDWTSTPQPGTGVTYARKIDKAEAEIDWSEPADLVARKIRAFSPFPGAFTMRDGARLKLLMAKAEEGPDKERGTPGEILESGNLLVACGKGTVRITRLQAAGKPPMDTEVYLRGKPFTPGDILPS